MRDSFFAVSFCTSYAPYPFIKEENSNNMVGGCASSFFLPFAFCDFGSDGSNCEEPPLPPTTGGIFRYYGFLTPSFFLPFTFFEYGSRLAQMLGKTRSRLTTSCNECPVPVFSSICFLRIRF
ncbi:MAG: hypothetical protein SOU94_03925, partial [Acidaminococcus sp.]|uniref:hypothetical protein n=1 Tax=Acidaminococcus sp. TaxID=1872103 RepID=UPI002A75C224